MRPTLEELTWLQRWAIRIVVSLWPEDDRKVIAAMGYGEVHAGLLFAVKAGLQAAGGEDMSTETDTAFYACFPVRQDGTLLPFCGGTLSAEGFKDPDRRGSVEGLTRANAPSYNDAWFRMERT